VFQIYEPLEAGRGGRCKHCGREAGEHEACEYFRPQDPETCRNCGVGSDRHHLCSKFTPKCVGLEPLGGNVCKTDELLLWVFEVSAVAGRVADGQWRNLTQFLL
jgi:hypothetical protein